MLQAAPDDVIALLDAAQLEPGNPVYVTETDQGETFVVVAYLRNRALP